jgi:hypothetical protein
LKIGGLPYGEINKLPYGEINKLPYGEINKLPYGEINKLPYGEINKLAPDLSMKPKASSKKDLKTFLTFRRPLNIFI